MKKENLEDRYRDPIFMVASPIKMEIQTMNRVFSRQESASLETGTQTTNQLLLRQK